MCQSRSTKQMRGGAGATEVSTFSPNIKFVAASCCSRKQSWISVHYGAILNPVVVSVSMGSSHNHSSCSPGSPCFCAEALCLIPVCKEWGCNTQRCRLGADGRHGCDISPELKLPREVPRGRDREDAAASSAPQQPVLRR